MIADYRYLRLLIKWGLIGLFIRLVVMPFTLHPDLLFINYFPYLLSYHGVVDIYAYLKANFSMQIAQLGWFYYAPLTYYTIGFFQFIFRPFTPLMPVWLANIGQVIAQGGGFSQHYVVLTGTEQLFRNLFFLKLPYLVFDFTAAFILLNMIDQKAKAVFAFKLWMLNPVVIFVSYIFGQFDIIPTLFVLLCLFSIKNDKRYSACLFLGIGAAYKNFPFILLLPVILLLGRNWFERVKMLAIGLLPYLMVFIPLYFTSAGYVKAVIFPDVIGQKIGGSSFISYAQKGFLAVGYFAILLHAYRNHSRGKTLSLAIKYFAVILLLMYALMAQSFHYFLWVTPMVLLEAVYDRKYLWIYSVMIVCLAVPTFVGKAMFGGLLTPISLIFAGLPSFDAILGAILPFNLARSLFLFVFSILCLGMSWQLFRARNIEFNEEN
jgi:hypothetical protein